MDRTKRQLEEYDYNNNKKVKLENEIPTIKSNKNNFENLANETIYEIFEYLDMYHIYQSFYHLNTRFENLILHQNSYIQIHIPTMSKSDFNDYHQHMIKPNLNRINYLHLSNPFSTDLIFSPPRLLCSLYQLQTLILDNIHSKYFNNLFRYLATLPNLTQLNLTLIEYMANPAFIFLQIFRLPHLKSCQLTIQSHNILNFYLHTYIRTPIENLVLNARIHFEALHDLLTCLPDLQHLKIYSLFGRDSSNSFILPIQLKNLKSININIESLHFYQFGDLLKNYFNQIESLAVSIFNNDFYLNAKYWEELIENYLPNLRRFDLQTEESTSNNYSYVFFSIMEFSYSFWKQKNWFFSNQRDTRSDYHNGMFYSDTPYRRKSYQLYHQSDSKMTLDQFKTVEHLYICHETAFDRIRSYFPNVTELTIKEYVQIRDYSQLDQVFPLKKLKKISIESFLYPMEEVVQLLNLTTNLNTLKINSINLYQTSSTSMQQNHVYHSFAQNNQIKYVELPQNCSLDNLQLIGNLFPSIQYLKLGLYRKDILLLIRYLINNMKDLFYLCIKQIPKVCFQEIKLCIQREKLLQNYSIKLINRDLYIWW